MRGKKRPPVERARAVGLAVMTSIAEASRQTGIPQPTIHAWFHSPEFEELRTRKKDVVAEEWWAGVQKAFRRTVDLLNETMDPVKAATAGAIMFDKMALSRGEATGRTEYRDLSAKFEDHENDVLSELIRSELERRSNESAAASAVEVVEQTGATRPN